MEINHNHNHNKSSLNDFYILSIRPTKMATVTNVDDVFGIYGRRYNTRKLLLLRIVIDAL